MILCEINYSWYLFLKIKTAENEQTYDYETCDEIDITLSDSFLNNTNNNVYMISGQNVIRKTS